MKKYRVREGSIADYGIVKPPVIAPLRTGLMLMLKETRLLLLEDIH